MKNFLPGLKTHIVVIGGLVTIVGMYLSGDMELGAAIQRALEVLSISTLRIAVTQK